LGFQRLLGATLAFAVIIFMASCSSGPSKPTAPGAMKPKIEIKDQNDVNEDQAQALVENGQLAEAALLYNSIADTKSSPHREQLKFKAVRLMINSGNTAQATRILIDMDIQPEQAEFAEAAILQARIRVVERQADPALFILGSIEEKTPTELLVEFLQTRISALKLKQNYTEAAIQHMNLHNLLTTDEQRQANEQAIIENLALLPAKELRELMDKTPSVVGKGWMQLSLHLQETKDPLRLSGVIRNWRIRYSNHPASETLLAGLAPPVDNTPPNLSHIAILLPTEGPFASAAQAIRDGFLSAFYHAKDTNDKPVISLHNTAGTKPIQELYNEAVAGGATIVVGPLDKKNITELAANAQLSIPVLALNHVEDENFFAPNLYQFGLSPEDEATQVAQRAWFDGHNEAAIIVPEGSWGDRVVIAFRQRWEQLGGVVVTEERYPSKNNDFSTSITKMLNIDQSEQRKKNLSGLLGAKLAFEARRRQDIDFIFMGAFPRQARLIPPQLKFFNAGDLPIYTTSHAFSGKIDRGADRDMNGVLIGDMPWTLVGNNASPVRGEVYRTFRKNAQQLGRLYALGVDAYNVLYYINWLRGNTSARLNGATGIIHMALNNRLERDLTWARFTSGKPEVLALTPTLSSF